MAKGFNKVILMGNLTRDPELRAAGSTQVCAFGIAVNRQWNNANGEKQEAVDFFDCVAWGKAGEIIERYVKKGQALLVSGRLSTSSWEQDGQKRSKVEITVEDFNFVGGGVEGGSSSYGGSSAPSNSSAAVSKPAAEKLAPEIDDKPIDLSDIPF